jgi:hypothetical protein
MLYGKAAKPIMSDLEAVMPAMIINNSIAAGSPLPKTRQAKLGG